MKKIVVLNGINLNMFGKRDASHYGTSTLKEIDEQITALGAQMGYQVDCFQSNIEGELAARIHQAHEEGAAAIIINAGAWTHYSYGIADALAIFKGPIVEVHMSNVHAREKFRHTSVFANVVKGQICGFGTTSYKLGLIAADEMIKEQ